jgi:release factor glutamine methyltransferase
MAAMTLADALVQANKLGLDRLDAQLLLLHALGKPHTDRAWLLAHDADALDTATQAHFTALAARRALGEPAAYLTGYKAFYGLDLQVDARVLVPRPDTETLVDWALAVIDNHPQRAQGIDVLDLGTGSGAIALAIAHSRPTARVFATDLSQDALAVAQANATRLGINLRFGQGAWFDALHPPLPEPLPQRFDLIVSNPPYIATNDAHLAALTHEPIGALASGPDGLDDIRHIIAHATKHLNAGGHLLLEHGFDQAVAARALLQQANFTQVQSRLDLNGIERCTGGVMAANPSLRKIGSQ